MTVKELAESAGFGIISLPEPEREIAGVYIGDLLSWVMGRAKSDDLWITIMSSVNVVAVAMLSDVSAILLAEGVTLDGDTLAVAVEKGVNVISAEISAYDAAIRVRDILK